MFRAHAMIIRRSKLHYTASGINTHKQNFCASGWLITEINDKLLFRGVSTHTTSLHTEG